MEENQVAVPTGETEVEVAEFDFSQLDTKTGADEGFEVEIMKPDGETSGLFITVLGQDAEAYQKLQDKQNRNRTKKLSKLGRAAIDGMYDDGKENDFALTAVASIRWRRADGKPLPFDIGTDKTQAVQFYKTYPVAYDQVRVAINDRSNFTKASAKQ